MLSLVAEAAAAPTAAAPTPDDHTHAAASDSPAGLALFLSILALLVAIGGAVLGRRAHATYRVLVRSAVRGRLRPALVALFLSAGVVLTGCGGSDATDADEGHDHSAAPAQVEGPEDSYAGLDLAEPYRRPSFTLTDTTGAAYDFKAATAGRPTLLFFGYTNCPDVCPTTMANVAVALRRLDPAVARDLQVVFVTTDPAFDTPAVLGEYLGRFDADLPTPFIGLTGDQDGDRPGPAGHRRAPRRGGRPAALVVTAAVRKRRRGARGLRRRQHPRTSRPTSARWRRRRDPGRRPGCWSSCSARSAVLALAGPASAHVGGERPAATSTAASCRSRRRSRGSACASSSSATSSSW